MLNQINEFFGIFVEFLAPYFILSNKWFSLDCSGTAYWWFCFYYIF